MPWITAKHAPQRKTGAIRAPADGYVTLITASVGDRALQARSTMSFIVEDEITLLGLFSQNGFQTVKDGALVDIVFDNVPGHVYHARVIGVPKGIGQGQVAVSGTLARTTRSAAQLRSRRLSRFLRI